MILGYLDAESGSLIVQALIGGAAGIAVAFRAWRARLTGKRVFEEMEVEEPAEGEG